jgi:hypothetical protein
MFSPVVPMQKAPQQISANAPAWCRNPQAGFSKVIGKFVFPAVSRFAAIATAPKDNIAAVMIA